MVAVDTEHPDDERNPALQVATRQLIFFSRIAAHVRIGCERNAGARRAERIDTETGRHLEHRTRLKHWLEPLEIPPARASLHVVEGASAPSTLLELARANHVDLIVLGAPDASQRALAWWRSVASSVRPTRTAASTSFAFLRVDERCSSTRDVRKFELSNCDHPTSLQVSFDSFTAESAALAHKLCQRTSVKQLHRAAMHADEAYSLEMREEPAHRLQLQTQIATDFLPAHPQDKFGR